MNQGTSANIKGQKLEDEIENILSSRGAKTMKYNLYSGKEKNVLLLDAPYAKPINKKGVGKTEFVYVNNNGKHIRIECKRQNGPGTTIDKFDCVFKHALRDMPEHVILIIVDGATFDERVMRVLREDLNEQRELRNSSKDVRVMHVEEFVQWLDE